MHIIYLYNIYNIRMIYIYIYLYLYINIYIYIYIYYCLFPYVLYATIFCVFIILRLITENSCVKVRFGLFYYHYY